MLEWLKEKDVIDAAMSGGASAPICKAALQHAKRMQAPVFSMHGSALRVDELERIPEQGHA